MGGCIKTLSCISAAVHVLFNILGFALTTLICVWYSTDSRKELNKEIGLSDTPFYLFVVLAIYFVFGLLSTISLIKGIQHENHKLFDVFFSSMIIIILLIAIRALVLLAKHIEANCSAGAVAAEFLMDISYGVFSGVVMIPCFIMYKELAGQSYLDFVLDYFMWWRPKHKPTLVSNSQV